MKKLGYHPPLLLVDDDCCRVLVPEGFGVAVRPDGMWIECFRLLPTLLFGAGEEEEEKNYNNALEVHSILILCHRTASF